jgi:hypothetical protein
VLRESQLAALALPKVYLAVAADVAIGLHPGNTQDVAARVARTALGALYAKNEPYIHPMYDSMKIEGGKIRITLKNLGGGLIVKRHLSEFQIAGEDKKFIGARADREGDAVVVWNDTIPKPALVNLCGSTYEVKKVDEDGKAHFALKDIAGWLDPKNKAHQGALSMLGLGGFAIAGEDQKFVWAEAKLDGDTILVWSEKVPKPVAVRYGWMGIPYYHMCLYSKEGLPVIPFRTDTWPVVTQAEFEKARAEAAK